MEQRWSETHVDDEDELKSSPTKVEDPADAKDADSKTRDADSKTKDADPKTKDDPKTEEDIHLKTLKISLGNQQKTTEMVLGNAKDGSSGISEKDKLDQDDQRIKVVELDKLEDSTEGNSSIACGDWIHRIKPAISNLSKRANTKK